LRLNLGCGHHKMPGWVNVDKFSACAPDLLVDLETFPWPWPDGAVREIRMGHVLEHLGGTSAVYIGVMKELWRVCADGATITITVPHPRHDDYVSDPTHVRPITANGLTLFSRKANDYWKRANCSNTPLAYYHGVDFDLVSADYVLDEPWASDLGAGRIDRAAADQAVLRYNNVIKEQQFVLRVVKPG
jgi:hypothetical protein